ncbi:MAG: hypothetical protein EBZ59_03515 [Planctomycetia bacterium]|nr:hypothetical protein [Planctomycetia bacterium]
MIRRHVLSGLAVLAIGLVVAAPAEAGGTAGASGVKKNATVIVKNATTTSYYVLVVPQSLITSTKFGTPGTVGWAKKLGGVLVNKNSQVAYPVPAGPGVIAWILPANVPANPNAELGEPEGALEYTVAKGKTVTKTIQGSTAR